MAMVKVSPEDIQTKMNLSNIIFHMEAKKGWIVTYGSSTTPVTTKGIHIETATGFIDNRNRECIRADEDEDLGTITIKDNLFAPCRTTKQCTISFWIFLSDIVDNADTFHPYSGNTFNEFFLDDETFLYRTEKYYSGITYKNMIPNNKWVHILLNIDARDHVKSRLSLYVNGEVISTGYTKDGYDPGTSTAPSSGFGIDFNKIVSSKVNNIWELCGNKIAGLYFLREFTIFDKCLVNNVEKFYPPKKAISALFPSMVLTNRIYLGYLNIGSKDPHPINIYDPSNPFLITGTKQDHGIMKYIGGEQMNSANVRLDPEAAYEKFSYLEDIAFIEDHNQYIGKVTKTFTVTNWNGPIRTVGGVQKVLCSFWMIFKYHKHVTPDQGADWVDMNGGTTLADPSNPYKSGDGIKQFSGYITIKLNGRPVKRSETPVYNKVDEYEEFDDKVTELVNLNGINTLEIDTHGMPLNNIRIYVINFEMIDGDGGLRKGVLWDIYSRLVVPDYWMTKDFNCKIKVVSGADRPPSGPDPKPGVIIKWRMTLEIPFPYTQFTEMQWLLFAPDGSYIPEIFYDRIDEYHIQFKDFRTFDAGSEDEFKFVFLHKHGFYAVNKFEQSFYATPLQQTYQFNSPYDNIVDLQKRVRVFINREFVQPDLDLYKFDNSTGMVEFTSKFTFSKDDLITLFCFYTGTKKNDRTIARLPMSGYIEFRPSIEDRVWDKNSFAVFMNGKLLPREYITDMTSTIHKINVDIKTRYNLEVLNMAPRISYLTPYILAAHKRIETKDVVWEFPAILTVPYEDVFRKRYYIEPDIFNPVEWKELVPNNLDWYITLVHHGLNKAEKDYQRDLTYTLKFFRDQYQRTPDRVNVVGQVRLKGNIEEFHPDSTTNTLIGILPSTLTNIDEDTPLFTIQARIIFNNDSEFSLDEFGKSIDGIMCRLEVMEEKKDKWYRVYYELVCDNYERDTEIEVLEWIISSEPNGEGDIWYRKLIQFLPFDTPNFPPMD